MQNMCCGRSNAFGLWVERYMAVRIRGPGPAKRSDVFSLCKWQIDINVVTFDTFGTPVELGAHNF